MMRFSFLFILIILSFSLHSNTYGFLLTKGKIETATRYRQYNTHQFWNSSGKRCESWNSFCERRGDLYLGYGLTDRDTLEAQGGYSRVDESANGAKMSWTDSEWSWKRRLATIRQQQVVSRALIIIPSGNGIYNLRYGRAGGEIDLLASGSSTLFNQRVWHSFGAGYRGYRGYPSDQLRGYFSAGSRFWGMVSLIADVECHWGLFNGKRSLVQNLFQYNPNYRLIKGRLYGTLNLGCYGYFYAGRFQHLWGRNVGTGGGSFAGLGIRF